MIANNSVRSHALPYSERHLSFGSCLLASFTGGFISAFVISVAERMVGLLSTYEGRESVIGLTKMDIKGGFFMGTSFLLLLAPAMYFAGKGRSWVGYLSSVGVFCAIQAICLPYMNLSKIPLHAASELLTMPLISLAGVWLAYAIADQIVMRGKSNA